MNKLINLYHKFGRWGILVLLGILIIFGVFNRLYLVIQYGMPDYILEVLLIILTVVLIYLIYKKNIFEFNKLNVFKTLLVLGIIFRITLAIHDFYNRPVQDSDYLKHEKLGARIAFEGKFYDYTGIELRNFRQPGLPMLFAAGLLIYNNPVTYSIVMIIFSFGVLIAGFFLFKDLKNIAALFSFAYLSVSPNMLFMASSSNTQLSFFFFLILLFIALKRYNGKVYQLIIIGALLAIEMYIRFNFLMIFLLIPFIIEKHENKKLIYSLSKIGIAYLSFLILYSPWVYRNYVIYGRLRLMPTTGLGLYSSNVTKDYTKMGGYNGVPDSVLNKYKDLSEIEFDKSLKNEAIEFVKSNPILYVKGIPFRLIKYSGRQDWTISFFFDATKYSFGNFLEMLFQFIENFFFWIVILYPFIYLLKNKKLNSLSVYLLCAYLTYSMVLLPISESRSRYNFPYILFPLFAIAFVEKRKAVVAPVKL